jgi:hypothetical protein
MAVCLWSATALAQAPSPAEQKVAAAQKAVAAQPDKPDGYNELALALARRARETADATYYDKAEQAVAQSLQLAPGNVEAQKMRAWVLLGKHELPTPGRCT